LLQLAEIPAEADVLCREQFKTSEHGHVQIVLPPEVFSTVFVKHTEQGE
jgi:hypothetical protein